MKKIIVLLAASFIACVFTANAQSYVNGYYRQNGTYVQGYYRSNRNNTNHDNFSTRGNTNSYTGSVGSVAHDYTPQANNYGSGQTIYSSPQGGQYYINSNGNRTYVPKRSSFSGNSYSYGVSNIVYR